MDKDYYSHIGIPPPLQFEPQQLNSVSMHSSNSYLNTHWDNNSTDQYTHFDSALSSIVSSPVTSINSNNNLPLQEFIGKLGTTCSPYYDHNNNNNNNNNESTMTSCYTTPLNSPPKILHMPIIESQLGKSNISTLANSVPMNHPPSFPTLSANKLSCFGRRSFNSRTSQDGLNNSSTGLNNSGNLPRVSSSPGLNKHSGQIPESNANSNEECCRKRKTVSRGKGKKNGLNKVEDEDGISEKRLKLNEGDGDNNGSVKMEETKGSEDNEAAKESKEKVVEPVKDYIHVRARRGEATDSHSLAERVRREKISQRMKLLQDLVPGCNKVTGKALMLDEIINYVQTLQRQVEFLSMKLATVNPRLDFHFDNLLPKEICQPNGCLPQHVFSLDGFGENLAQIPTICEDELQSIVQMGFNHNSSQDLTLHSQTFSVPNSTSYMKIEM